MTREALVYKIVAQRYRRKKCNGLKINFHCDLFLCFSFIWFFFSLNVNKNFLNFVFEKLEWPWILKHSNIPKYRNAKRIVPFNATDIFKSGINVLDLIDKNIEHKTFHRIGKKEFQQQNFMSTHTEKKKFLFIYIFF